MVSPVVRVRTQVVYGNRNWVPLYIYGTTPSFLDVRDWENMAEGETFTDRDVLGGTKVCLLGQTLVCLQEGGQVSRGGCVPTATGSERVSGSDNPSRHCGSSGCDDASGPAPWVRPGLGRPRRRWTT